MQLSLAHLKVFTTVWPSGALYLPCYLNKVGRRSGPWMSQQKGNQYALINATQLSTGTTKELCRFSCVTQRNDLMNKKDLWRLSSWLYWAWVFKFMLFSAPSLILCSVHDSPESWGNYKRKTADSVWLPSTCLLGGYELVFDAGGI